MQKTQDDRITNTNYEWTYYNTRNGGIYLKQNQAKLRDQIDFQTREYMCFEDELLSFWKETIILILQERRMLETLKESNIALMLPGNYRLIFFLNNDSKLFRMILANIIIIIILEFIHEDQSGFSPKRQLREFLGLYYMYLTIMKNKLNWCF